jgi:hypothetical protein
MNFRWNTNTMACHAGLELSYGARTRGDRAGTLLEWVHAHQLMPFHWQHIAEPPHSPANGQNQADDADNGLRDQPSGQKRESGRGDKRPCGWRRQANGFRNLFLFLLSCHVVPPVYEEFTAESPP